MTVAQSLPPTEQRLDASRGFDRLTTLQRLSVLNDQDTLAVHAVRRVLPDLADVVDETAKRMRADGTVHYFGAGTSGRLAVLDAVELLPTFALPPGTVVPHIAGGEAALTRALEDVEDSEPDGAAAAAQLGPNDVAIGLTASGTTPFVGGALGAARERGAYTVLVSCNPASPLAGIADQHIALDTGPEAVTGSTRLKAGTAQKLVLNGFSTALMVALGRTWSNLMVSVVATNHKLRERTVRILRDATGLDDADARAALTTSDGDLKTAIVTTLTGLDTAAAMAALVAQRGDIAAVIREH